MHGVVKRKILNNFYYTLFYRAKGARVKRLVVRYNYPCLKIQANRQKFRAFKAHHWFKPMTIKHTLNEIGGFHKNSTS